jgi:hypothetical protein
VIEVDAQDAAKVAKTASVLGHVRENHVSYLLGLLALHSMGLLTTAQETVGGCI